MYNYTNDSSKLIDMKFNIKTILFALSLLIFASCKEAEDEFEAPYPAGKPALGVIINTAKAPVPAEGIPGITVKIEAKGLLPYKDKLKFFFSGEQAEVLAVTENGIEIKVPNNASSGVTSIMIDDKIVFGPTFKVQGLIANDATFKATNGANGSISQYLKLSEGKYLFVGGFSNYDNKGVAGPINRIVRTFLNGDIDRTFRTRQGANGYLSGVVQIGSSFYISGSFNGYDQRKEYISNLTRLNNNGSIDTMMVKVFTPRGKRDTLKSFPEFNGGTDEGIEKLYTFQGRLIATGNFRYYVSRRYDQPNRYETKDSVILDSTEVRQVVRINPDGTLDKSYRFDAGANKSLPGGNGYLNSYMHGGFGGGANDGKLLLFGSFTTFDAKPAGHIIRLNSDGSVDASFKAGVGANNSVGFASFNDVTGKYMITGTFRSYDGQAANNIAMLNTDGTMDKTFVPKVFSGGFVRGAKQLNDGLIVVFGDFKRYGEYTRNGFMVLTPQGELAPGFNATGIFNGTLSDVVETVSEDGKRALMLIGQFDRFDNLPVQNITRIIIE